MSFIAAELYFQTKYDLKPLYIKQEAEILWLQVSWRASLKRPLYPDTAHSKNPVVKRHSSKNSECKFLATQKHRALSFNYTEFKKPVHKYSFFKQDIFWVCFLKKKTKYNHTLFIYFNYKLKDNIMLTIHKQENIRIRTFQFLLRHIKSLKVVTPILRTRKAEQTENSQLFYKSSENCLPKYQRDS